MSAGEGGLPGIPWLDSFGEISRFGVRVGGLVWSGRALRFFGEGIRQAGILIFGSALVIWGVVAAMFLSALVSFKATFPAEMMTLAGLLFMTGLVNLGLLIPALPGNVGTYEALCVAAMAVFGVTKELAVAFALVFHVGQLVTTLAVGGIAFWTQNLSLAEMRPTEQAAEQEAAQSLDAFDRGTHA